MDQQLVMPYRATLVSNYSAIRVIWVILLDLLLVITANALRETEVSHSHGRLGPREVKAACSIH